MPKNQTSSLQNPTDSGEEQLLEKTSPAQEEINKITKDIPLKALEDISIKDKEEVGKVAKDKTAHNKEDITVYTMPKQFVGVKEEEHKKTGTGASDLNNK